MLRLTLRTLLAYLDDTLPPAEAKSIGQKLAESPQAQEIVERIRRVTRKRSLSTPPVGAEGGVAEPNTVAAYLSDNLSAEQLTTFEQTALDSDVHLADVAACHQILTLVLSEQVRVPPTAYKRMYALVKGPESIPTRSPGRGIPIGGTVENDVPADDAADAQYLLGMAPYSRSQPVGQRVLKWAVAGLLAAGFGVTAWLAWPKGQPPAPPKAEEVAKTPPADPKKDEPKKDDTKKDDPKKDDAPDKLPDVPPTLPDPMPKPPDGDLVPAAQPPKAERVAVAKCDSPDDRVLLVKRADGDTWARVTKDGPVSSTDKCVCPPGYTAKLRFETGAAIELWANVFPDLQPLPVFDTALTPHAVYDGFDADFTLHTGRVYLTGGRATGAAFRVRFRDEVWDVTLPDDKSEAVVQVVHAPTPGAVVESAKTTAVLHVLKGTAGLKVRFKSLPKIAAGELVDWDSKGGKLNGPIKPDGMTGKDSVYFNKSPVYPNTKTAQPMLKALDEFAERLKEAKSIPAALAELRAEPNAPPTAVYFAGGRFSVLAAAAVGDLGAVADALNDSNRQDLRAAGVAAVRHLLATYPEMEEKFRQLAGTKLRLTADQTTALLRTLRGIAPEERADLDTLTKLVDQLKESEVVQREAALFVLLTDVDPTARSRPGLVFDPAAGAEVREAACAAWKKRVEEVAKEAGKGK